MSFASVVILPLNPKLDPVLFDITKKEDHSLETEITDSPVEDGTTRNDHAIHKPRKFTCTVAISNTPIARTFEGDGLYGAIVLSIPGYPPTQTASGFSQPTPPRTAQAIGLTFDLATDRVRETLDKLDALRLGVELLTVVTTKRVYDSMVLTKVDLPIEGGSGRGAFTLTFQELQIVTTDQVTAPAPKEPRGAPSTTAATSPDPANPLTDAVEQGKKKFTEYTSFKSSVANDLVGDAVVDALPSF